MPSETRERIVGATAELFRHQGYSQTGVKQIVETAGAPFASLYHFFPGGKDELAAETVRWSGAIYGQLLDEFFRPGEDPVAATRAFFAGAAGHLAETDYADACPIATVALEVSSTNEPLRKACADVFDAWLENATRRLKECGLTPARARRAGISIIALLEGAFVLSRALRTTEPLEAAGRTAADEVRRLLEASRRT